MSDLQCVGRLVVVTLTWLDFATDLLLTFTLASERRWLLVAVSCTSLGLAAAGAWSIALIELRGAWLRECQHPGASAMDFEQFGRSSAVFAAILLLCASNANLLILLPWRGPAPYCGFPTASLLWRAQGTSMLEDVPHIAIQIAYLSHASSSDRTLAAFSLLTSVFSLLWRLLRKLLGQLAAGVGGRLPSASLLRPSQRLTSYSVGVDGHHALKGGHPPGTAQSAPQDALARSASERRGSLPLKRASAQHRRSQSPRVEVVEMTCGSSEMQVRDAATCAAHI